MSVRRIRSGRTVCTRVASQLSMTAARSFIGSISGSAIATVDIKIAANTDISILFILIPPG
jgi:hypothetical protein